MRDLALTVACVQHAELEDVHRQFLGTLVPFATYATGRNVHPGYEYLAIANQKSQETVRRYARHCEKLGLIEVVKKPDGKGIATEWRICLENSAYPDTYPGFKALGPRLYEDQERRLGPHKTDVSSSQESVKVHAEVGLAPRLLVDPSTPTSTPASTASPLNKQDLADQKEIRRWMQRTYEKARGEGMRASKESWLTPV